MTTPAERAAQAVINNLMGTDDLRPAKEAIAEIIQQAIDEAMQEKEEYRPMATNSYEEIHGWPERTFTNEMAGRPELNE